MPQEKLQIDTIQIRDMRNRDWFWCNKLIMNHPKLSSSGKLIYQALTYFSNHNTQEYFPSIDKIMELTGLCKQTIITSLNKLEKLNLIKIEKQGRGMTYTLLEITKSQPVQKLDLSKQIQDTTSNNKEENNEIWIPGLGRLKTF